MRHNVPHTTTFTNRKNGAPGLRRSKDSSSNRRRQTTPPGQKSAGAWRFFHFRPITQQLSLSSLQGIKEVPPNPNFRLFSRSFSKKIGGETAYILTSVKPISPSCAWPSRSQVRVSEWIAGKRYIQGGWLRYDTTIFVSSPVLSLWTG